jgi:D-sedoheptulose 7-phosphate isomerase
VTKNRVEQLFAASDGVGAFADGYFAYLGDVLSRVDRSAIASLVNALVAARENGRRIYILGNGGSAATAGHFANDLLVSVRPKGRPFLAQSLSENTATITAVSNDFGYENVFLKQLEHRVTTDDLVIAFSASGNSPNVLKAVDYANTCGCLTVGFTGFDGGELRRRCTLSIHVPTETGEYGPAEDAHLALEHMVTNYLMLRLRQPDSED